MILNCNLHCPGKKTYTVESSLSESINLKVVNARSVFYGGTLPHLVFAKIIESTDTQAKSQLPMNLISTTNQEKVSSVPVKQQIPLKLASRLSSGAAVATGAGGPTQMLPLKLSQDEKIRRTSTSGYQRLSPPSGETVKFFD
jgi:hypothetical protein